MSVFLNDGLLQVLGLRLGLQDFLVLFYILLLLSAECVVPIFDLRGQQFGQFRGISIPVRSVLLIEV